MIFDGSDSDFANYQAANLATQATLWRAQTQTKKLSLFAEAYFRNLAKATGVPIMLSKRDLYRLIECCDVNSIDLEVVDKLDTIYRLVQPCVISVRMLSSHGLHVAQRQLGDTLAQIQPWQPPDMDLVLRPQLQSVDGNPEERKRRSSETS